MSITIIVIIIAGMSSTYQKMTRDATVSRRSKRMGQWMNLGFVARERYTKGG